MFGSEYPGDGLPPEWLRRAIAKAVDESATEDCQRKGRPPWATSALYAELAAALTTQVTGKCYCVLAGALAIQNDPDCEYYFVIDSESPEALDQGSCHCWAARPFDEGKWEIVDVFSRHYRTLFEQCLSMPSRSAQLLSHGWKVHNPPDFLWTESCDLPPWLVLIPHPQLTDQYNQRHFIWANEALVDRAWSSFKNQVGLAGCAFSLN